MEKIIKIKGVSFLQVTEFFENIGVYQTTIKKGNIRFDFTHSEPICTANKVKELKKQAINFYFNYCN